jgi:hypothetical protein
LTSNDERIDRDENNAPAILSNGYPSFDGYGPTWTGTTGTGVADGSPLGSGSPRFGIVTPDLNAQWVSRGSTANTGYLLMYGISEPLTIQGALYGTVLIVR